MNLQTIGRTVLCAAFSLSCFAASDAQTTSQLLVALPDFCPTPDGMAVDTAGNLVVACPNFADSEQPGCLIRIDSELNVSRLGDVPPLPETGKAYPMGIAFGPDGELYVCDNQNWPTGNGDQGEINQGRLLRLELGEDGIRKATVVAAGISHPNGVRVHKGQVYVTVSMLPKVRRADGLLVSAVYRFESDDEGIRLTNTLKDENLLVSFVTKNRDCQYGADGLAFDSCGNLFVGNFGDGALHKVTFDDQGNVTGQSVFAKTDFNTPMTSPDFAKRMTEAKMRTTDGICIDENDHVYVADFSNNAVCKVDRQGRITVLAQSPDSDGSRGELDQPGEPILWNGKLVVSCFDIVTGPDKINTGHDRPFTLAWIKVEPE
jgi:sugar lactone lactonase YvrE